MNRQKSHKPLPKAKKGVPIAGLITKNERQWLLGIKKELKKNGDLRKPTTG